MSKRRSIHDITKLIMTPDTCVFVQGSGNYTLLIGAGQVVVYAKTMRLVCERYPFLTRIHKKHAVNLAKVNHVRLDKETGQAYAVTKTGNSLEISRRYYSRLHAMLKPFEKL